MEKQQASAKGKIEQICNILKKETIEPAKQEASEIIENARMEAKELIQGAQKKAEEIEQTARRSMEEKKATFDASLHLAAKQTVETLKQKIEKELFNSALEETLKHSVKDPQILANLINSIVSAIDKEGIDVDLSACIAKDVSAKTVTGHLLDKVRERLREHAVQVGEFAGGIQVKMHDREITIDMTAESLKDLIASFVRKEFRQML